MHEIKNVNQTITESQDFLGKKYDAQQKKTHDLIVDNRKMHRENIELATW